VLLFGLVVYLLGCIGAASAGSFPTLLAMRGIQGIGAGATRVIAISIIRDTYGGRRMASVMSLAMMVFMAVPIIAPNIGQAILMVAGWRSILVAIAIFGLMVTIWCFLRLPETLHPEDRRSLRVRPILDAFRIVVSNRVAAGYAVGAGLVFGCLFAFLNSAQQIYQEEYNLGALFPVALGWRCLHRHRVLPNSLVERPACACFPTVRSPLHCGVGTALRGKAFNEGTFLLDILSSAPVTFCMFAFMGTNFTRLPWTRSYVAGTASSVLSSVQTILGGALGAVIGLVYDGTVLPLTLGYLILSLLSFGVIALTEPRRLFGRADALAVTRTPVGADHP
jgi:DHA1 family bicyclomycin/chloramphenicol resistance-like MFS transporter